MKRPVSKGSDLKNHPVLRGSAPKTHPVIRDSECRSPFINETYMRLV